MVAEPHARVRLEPLWDRIDRNRLKLAGFVTVFVLGSVLTLDLLLTVPLTALLLLQTLMDPVGFWSEMPRMWALAVVVTCAGAIAASAWAALTLVRSERWLLRRLRATLVPEGDLLATKYALKDMGLAAGVVPAPAMYVLETDNVNAFIFAARRRRAVAGVTQGFVDKLSVDEQRAAFANLMARLASGDVILSTGITSLMWPLHAWRDGTLRRQDMGFAEDKLETVEHDALPAAGVAGIGVFMWGFALAASLEFIAYGDRQQQLELAEKADAEGMLLLKDPKPMLTALEKAVRLDNYVPTSGEAFSNLFWCFTGPTTDDDDDPEWDRVRKLREVLGVEGFGAVVTPDDAELEGLSDALPPIAPRIEGG